MNIFPLDPVTYANGAIVNDLDSIIWVERYATAGEIKLVCEPTPYLRSVLAPDTLISHSETYDVMMIESHEIDDSTDSSPKLVITGRSASEIIMENRVIAFSNTSGLDADVNGWIEGIFAYYGLNTVTRSKITAVLNDCLVNSVVDSDENLPNFEVTESYRGSAEPYVFTKFDTLELLSTGARKLLNSIGAGLKTERPNSLHSKMRFIGHNGADKTSTVIFSLSNGDISRAKYLWTNKDRKNAAYVQGKYYGREMRDHSKTGWARRVLGVDAQDFETLYADVTHPDGYPPIAYPDYLESLGDLYNRGVFELATRTDVTLLEVEISPTNNYTYGIDYKIGDLVKVQADYGISQVFRVTEYARTSDDNGVSGIPTLTVPTVSAI